MRKISFRYKNSSVKIKIEAVKITIDFLKLSDSIFKNLNWQFE